jgi:hypothetical protein
MSLHTIAKRMGYKSNADFYKDFPDEASFLRAMGGELPTYQFGNFLNSTNSGLSEEPQGDEVIIPNDPNALGNRQGYQNTTTGVSSQSAVPVEQSQTPEQAGAAARGVAGAVGGPFAQAGIQTGTAIAGVADENIQDPNASQAVQNVFSPSQGIEQNVATTQKLINPGVDPETRQVEQTHVSEFAKGSGIGSALLFGADKVGLDLEGDATNITSTSAQRAGAAGMATALLGNPLAPVLATTGVTASNQGRISLKNGGKLENGGAIQAGDITAQMIGGLSHEASPMGGTPVDSNGSSSIASGQTPKALAEGGEPAVQFNHADTGESVSYVFPKDNTEVKKHLKALDRRPNDRATQASVNRALTDLMEENEAKNAINSVASLQQAFEPGVPIAKSGIHLDPAKKGTFKAMATRMGLSVQSAADKILNAAKGKYSAAMRKKANFAKNFAKEEGGMLSSLPTAGVGLPLDDEPQYEELGRADVDRTTQERILAGVGYGAQALPSLIALQNIPEAEGPLAVPISDKLDLTEEEVAAQADLDRRFGTLTQAIRQGGGSRQELLQRLQRATTSQSQLEGSQLTGIRSREKMTNLDLANQDKLRKFQQDLLERDRREAGAAAKFQTELQLQQNIGDITATGTRDELMRISDDRSNDQAMLALAARNPDIIAVRDPETGQLVLKRRINTSN